MIQNYRFNVYIRFLWLIRPFDFMAKVYNSHDLMVRVDKITETYSKFEILMTMIIKDSIVLKL